MVAVRFVLLLGAADLTAGCGLSEFPLPPLSSPVPVDAGGSANKPDAAAPTLDAPARDLGGAATETATAADGPPGTGAPDVGTAMPPVPPGPTIMIGDMAVPKGDVVVFLHIGHSNMAGRTKVPASLHPLNFVTHPRLWAYAKGGLWRLAKEPLSGDTLTRDGAGPGMSILHTALGLAPNKIMVSIGRGHDGSIGGHCRNFRKGALLYNFVMEPAMELKGKVTFGGIFTMLGVNEFRRDAANIPRFNECLAGIASDMRTDLGDPNIPFVMGDWEAGATGAFDPTMDYAIATKAQLKLAAANIPRSVLIPTEMLPMTDDHHYDLTGYKLWAERGFNLMRMGDLVPWAMP